MEQRECTNKKCYQLGCYHNGIHNVNEFCNEMCTYNSESQCEIISNWKIPLISSAKSKCVVV